MLIACCILKPIFVDFFNCDNHNTVNRASKSPGKRDSIAMSAEKQLREQETANKKEKALLTQKIELLELQLKDSQEREEQAKRMHNTILSAFNKDTEDGMKRSYF